MARIENPEQFKEWLKDKPAEWAQALILRAALRVLPLALDPGMFNPDMFKEPATPPDFTAAVVRALVISSAARLCPAHDMGTNAAHNAVKGTDAPYSAANSAYANAKSARLAYAAADAAANAADVAYDGSNSFSAAGSVFTVADAVVDANTNAALWQQLGEDCDILRRAPGADAQAQSLALLGQPLWVGKQMPRLVNDSWGRAVSYLEEKNLRFWLLWYQRRLAGKASGFGLPSEQDLIVQGRLLEQTDEWWTGGQHQPDLAQLQKITQEIEGWIAELRKVAVVEIKSELSEQFSDARRLISELKLDSKELNPLDQLPRLGHNNPPSEIDDLLEQGQDLVDSDSEDVEKYINLRDKLQGGGCNNPSIWCQESRSLY